MFSITPPHKGCMAIKPTSCSSQSLTSSIVSATPPASATSISASSNKTTFYVGETISKSNVSVEDNLSNSIDDFSFDTYIFTYEDANSGGALTDKAFTISYDDFECELIVQVQRKGYQTVGTSDKNVSYTDLPTAYQTSLSERTSSSGISFYAYNCANYSSKMQFKKNGGYFQTTSESNLKSLTINDRETNVLTVYAGTTSNAITTLISGSNDTYNLTGYKFVKVINECSYAAYCSSLTISIDVPNSAQNVANFIMFEDANNQCLTKFGTAKGYFEGLSKAERTTFMTSNDYVISTARTRLQAWATNQGKTITLSNGDYVISTNNVSPFFRESDQSMIIVIVAISSISLLAIAMFILKYKKKEL